MYAILSDIHGNKFALDMVINDMARYDIEAIILLGDLIDYCMQSNEVIDLIKSELQDKIICNIWGNHERAIMSNDYGRFSSERGKRSAMRTRSILSDHSVKYLDEMIDHSGWSEITLDGKKVLAVHGSLDDVYWKAINADDVRGDYKDYDIVLSGHSHYSHSFYKFYDTKDPERRNKHAVLFVNPGSVGQPRNHNPAAQYALLDIRNLSVNLRAIEYDVESAMDLFDGSVDDFYRTRLKTGI